VKKSAPKTSGTNNRNRFTRASSRHVRSAAGEPDSTTGTDMVFI
jgi:hypothetical protein